MKKEWNNTRRREERTRSVIRALISTNLLINMSKTRNKYIITNVPTEKACSLKIWMTLKKESVIENSFKKGLNKFQIVAIWLSKSKLLDTRNRCNLSNRRFFQMEIRNKYKSKLKWRASQILKFLCRLLTLEHTNYRF